MRGPRPQAELDSSPAPLGLCVVVGGRRGDMFVNVGRNLEEGKKNEYLLITVEAYEGEKTVELMVGVDLDLATVKVI